MSGRHAATRGGRLVPRLLRWLLIALVAAAVVVLLFTVVFPWVDERLINDPVMGSLVPVG